MLGTSVGLGTRLRTNYLRRPLWGKFIMVLKKHLWGHAPRWRAVAHYDDIVKPICSFCTSSFFLLFTLFLLHESFPVLILGSISIGFYGLAQ